MLRVSCNDMGIADCDFAVAAKRERQIRARMIEHFRVAHPDMVAGIDYEQLKELQARIKSCTRAAEPLI